jgi:hypothetical protein
MAQFSVRYCSERLSAPVHTLILPIVLYYFSLSARRLQNMQFKGEAQEKKQLSLPPKLIN